MIKVEDEYENEHTVTVNAFDEDELSITMDDGTDCGRFPWFLSFDTGMNLAAALVREIHGAREPRVWESADDVPDGVKVSFDWPSVGIRHTIRYGDVWVFFNDAGKSELWNYVVHLPDYYSPFIEVL